jgi:ATP-dependent helicase HrpB
MHDFPVKKRLEAIKASLQASENLVLTAQPGAGKSTLVPLELLDQSWLGNQKILMLQPRRVAAIAVAKRMAFLSNTKAGELVGHQVRFSSNIKKNTRIEVLTEGILTRRLQSDPFLQDVGLVIFDEFHERSIHSDLCLALCREIQKEIRPDLKILVMSATLEATKVADFLGDCPIISCEGFLYPVKIEYRPVSITRFRFDAMLEAFKEIVVSSDKNESYLVFLPGAGEINFFADNCHEFSQTHEILPLHGSLPVEVQEKVLGESQRPRIVLATNIAETSLTIDGISTVIDTGFCRRIIFDPATGLEKLELVRISRASASQRSGRAGRLGPGRAFRLWSKIEHEQLIDFELPEIQRVDLSSTLLELAGWGTNRPVEFAWFDRPDVQKLSDTQDLLKKLGAIDENGFITDLGKEMLKLPVMPRLARMLISAKNSGVAKVASLAAAIISEKDFAKRQDSEVDPDLFWRLQLVLNGSSRHDEQTDKRQISRVKRVAEQIFSELASASHYREASGDFIEPLARSLLAAFPDRVCQQRNQKNSYKICTGQGLRLNGDFGIARHKYLLALNLDANIRKTDHDGRIFLAIGLEKNWLLEELSHLCQINRELFFSETRKAVSLRKVTRFAELVLDEIEDSLEPAEIAAASRILREKAQADPDRAFALEKTENRQFLNRLNLLIKHCPDEGFSPIDDDWWQSCWTELLGNCISFAELQKNSLADLYFMRAGYQLKSRFDELVPEKIQVPSGSKISIVYDNDAEPYLRVKIQEMFGCPHSPAICKGRVKLVIHFLSPAGRPAQITRDLESFWKNGYKVVAAELKGRYPKHPWPDDPTRGVAFAGTKKQLDKKLKGR